MSQTSWEKAKKSNPEAFANIFKKFNTSDDATFKKQYKASSEAERKVIDEVLKVYGLHLMINNGRISVMEEIPQKAEATPPPPITPEALQKAQQDITPQQDVLISQVIQTEMQRQSIFERGKPLTKEFFKKAYAVISNVLSMFLSGVGNYATRHSPAEFAKAIFFTTLSVLMFQAYYAVVNFVDFVGVKLNDGMQAIGLGAQYTSDFVMGLFRDGQSNNFLGVSHEVSKEVVEDDYKVPRVSYEKEKAKEKDYIQTPKIEIQKITNPLIEPTRLASEHMQKTFENLTQGAIIMSGLSVFMLVALYATKEYFSHKRFIIEHEKKKEENNTVEVGEPQFHPDTQKNIKQPNVNIKPVAWQRNITPEDHERAQKRAENLAKIQDALNLSRSIRDRNIPTE